MENNSFNNQNNNSEEYISLNNNLDNVETDAGSTILNNQNDKSNNNNIIENNNINATNRIEEFTNAVNEHDYSNQNTSSDNSTNTPIETVQIDNSSQSLNDNNSTIITHNEQLNISQNQNNNDNNKDINIAQSKPSNEDNDSNHNKHHKQKKKGFHIFVYALLIVELLGILLAGIFVTKSCSDMPTLDVNDLVSPDSTTIYDNEGNKIMQIGTYLRENIEYDEMPNCLIDAFLAVEDSRFFEHIGFDIPRFSKAVLANINTGDFSQGGSTITMQLIKNSYFSIDAGDESTIASREGMSGVKRKIQEIALSLNLEIFKHVKKQDIIAMYINKINYGNNIRGVEKASEYYFGKSAKNLNLSEAAFLAGIINSPNTYNPYNEKYKYESSYLSPDINYLDNANRRKNEVLDLMLQHGYISNTEASLAKSVNIQNLLAGESNDFSETNEKYQWYIDAVIDEIEEMTGDSPYNVGMNVYTNMNPHMQEFLYDVQNEEEYTKIKFPNELCQSAVVLMDNQTGSIEAIGGGRGEIDSARNFNRATSSYLNPGSSIKPIIDYSLAIEKLGWATSHTITDQPYYLYGGNVLISNYDLIYHGDMLMTEALGRSQNTPAVQTLVEVINEIGEEGVVDYLNSVGFNFKYEDFDLQFAIGGNRCLVTPEQLAGAHAVFMNGGMYIKPHTIEHIEYVDGREDYVSDTKGNRVLSPEAAWMTAYLERYNMEGNYSSLMWYCKRDYPLYGKTGTTDWANSGTSFGIPVGSTKDSWLVMQTNRYTISCWTGYDKLEKGAYFSNAEYQENTKSKIVSVLLDELETHASYKDYDPSIQLEKPEGVVEITHVKGSYPYAKSGGEMITGYISKKALEKQPLVSYEEALEYSSKKIKEVYAGVSNIAGYYDGNNLTVSFSVETGTGGLLSGESVDISTTNYQGETTHAAGRIWFPHWTTVYTGSTTPPFFYRVSVNGVTTAEGSTDGFGFTAPAPGGTSCQACIWGSDGGNEVCQEFPIG